VITNIEGMPAYFRERSDRFADDGALQQLDPHVLLDRMKETYVMADQHVIHVGDTVVQDEDTEITFF